MKVSDCSRIELNNDSITIIKKNKAIDYKRAYRQKKLRRYTIRLHQKNDLDMKIAKHLKMQSNIQEYIRKLVLEACDKRCSEDIDIAYPTSFKSQQTNFDEKVIKYLKFEVRKDTEDGRKIVHYLADVKSVSLVLKDLILQDMYKN